MGSSIDPVLQDLELLESSSSMIRKPVFRALIRRLRNGRTFLLCATKLRKHAGTGSLLMQCLKCVRILGSEDRSPKSLPMRVENEIARFAQEIHPYCLSGLSSNLVDMPGDFLDEMELFDEEIDEWYFSLREHLLRSTSFPNADEVLEITDSVLDNLEDILCFYNEGMLSPELMQDLRVDLVLDSRDRIKFLKNLTRFAAMLRVGHPQFVTFLLEVAVVASHVSHRCQFFTRERSPHVISDMLKIGCPYHCLEIETYTRVLRSSRLLRELRAPSVKVDDEHRVLVNEEFLESLVFVLWEILQLDTCIVVSFKDQLQVLYEGLRFLRIAFKEQRHKFDQKTVILTQVVICEAGIIIFLLCQRNIEMDRVALSLVLGKIKLMRTEFRDQRSTFKFPKTNELGFVNFLIENLASFTINGNDSIVHGKNVQKIHEQLVFLRSFLEEIDDLQCKDNILQSFWDRAVLVAYRMEFLIDHFVFGSSIDSCQTMSLDSITEEITAIKNEALKILDGKRQDTVIEKVSRRSSRIPSQKSPITANEVVGFINEATAIQDQLTRGSKYLRIVAVVGMAGLGKTTLATKVYNDSSVVYHFGVCARCSISQVFNRKKVLLELLNHIMPDTYFDETNEEDLAEKLRHHLKGRRYLIFLDDVWDIEVWNSLEVVLPDDSNGSRILLTSRLQGVVPPYKLDEKPHFFRHLTADESWDLMKRKVFNGEDCSPALFQLGVRISETCKGLPLTIIIVAGLLAMTEHEYWGEVVESLSSGKILSSTDQCMNTIELSYKNLPDFLKPCFLYLGAFPEDQEVSVKKLIQLYMAEGFVLKTEFKSLEDVAEDYLMDLIGRSLVMVSKERSIGGIKACRIHDLLHEFCLMKAKEEHFFLLLRGYDELLAFNEPCYVRRLCIHSESGHLNDSRLFCPRVRTLMLFSQARNKEHSHFNVSFVIRIFKLLMVLDLGQANLGKVFPAEMELLAQLKYLAVRGEMEAIPSSFGNLSNLETFVVNSRGTFISLPDTLWNMRKLRHLKTSKGSWFILPMTNLESASILYELSSLSGAILCLSIMERQLRKIPNIRKLKCKLHGELNGDSYQIRVDVLTQLESLDISLYMNDADKLGNHVELGFPANLKKLTMSAFRMPWSKISVIGALPNLEVLNLLTDAFTGHVWEMEEGEFPKLKILMLLNVELDRWIACDEQFACLEKLVLHGGWIKEMPSCLEDISTLDMIKVFKCSLCTRESVKQIEKAQKSMGNSTLIVIIE